MARRPGLVDLAVLRIRQHIRSGAWPVGSRIPPEPDLAELLGVGRNTVREAVHALVHAGMLERRQGSGTYVTADSDLAVALSRHLADADFRDVLEVRRGLEVEAARLAAERRTDHDIAVMRSHLTERAAAARSGDLEALVLADLALHRSVTATSYNPVLTSLYESLLDSIQKSIRINFQRPMGGDEEHHALVEAIAAGDPDGAAKVLRDYFVHALHGSDPTQPASGAGREVDSRAARVGSRAPTGDGVVGRGPRGW